VNSLPNVVTQRCLEYDLIPRPTDRKSNAMPVALLFYIRTMIRTKAKGHTMCGSMGDR